MLTKSLQILTLLCLMRTKLIKKVNQNLTEEEDSVSV